MNIRLKLYATLTDLLPAGAKQNASEITVPDDADLAWLVDEYKIPHELAHLVLVNGHFHCASDWSQVKLQEGDTVAIWPPVAGG